MMIERTYIIGDIHGCNIEMAEILKLLDHKSPYVRVILLSDLIDRGPDSVGCVRLARELKLESVMGNHDYSALRWYRNRGSRMDVYDVPDYYHQFSNDDLDYIAKMPLYIKTDTAVIVHAGLRPNIPIEKQDKQDLLYLRYLDMAGKKIGLRKLNKPSTDKTGVRYWTECGSFDYDVIYGHHVHSLTDIRIDQWDTGFSAYGIDTGVVFGGKLTALCLETKEVIQVQAKKVYYQPDYI